MAKTLVDANQNKPKRLVILDESGSIGGTWAAERLYPGLKTNNVVGSYEFSDFPMDPARYGLKPGQHIPGSVVHEYFTDFAAHFGLDRLFRPRTRVEAATLRDDGTWELECHKRFFCEDGPPRENQSQAQSQSESTKMTCDKLIVATGLTSEARMPSLAGRERFAGPLFHAKDLHRRSQDLSDCQEVVVIGGNKSAWDVCYSVATGGSRSRAHMVIRKSGGGPSWVWRPIVLFSVRLTLARLSSTRLCSWFDPGPFGPCFSSIRRLLHATTLGTWLVWAFWAALDFLAAAAAGYDDPQLRMLRPWTSTFWMGNSLSVHNYESDWFELVRKGRIVVHHADVVSLGETTAHLSNGTALRADAIVCCTGWKPTPPITFRPEGISEEIGLPQETTPQPKDSVKASPDSPSQGNYGASAQARAQIKIRCAQLGFSPRRTIPGCLESRGFKPHVTTPLALNPEEAPYRLYRFLVPATPRLLRQRSIAFIGMHRSVHAVIVAQAQALWITAYLFDDQFAAKLERQQPEAVYRETMLHAEYERLRRPRESGGSGGSFPDLVFDSIPYTDLLLEDLGLRALRKGSLWANIIEPHLPADYRYANYSPSPPKISFVL